MFHAVSRTHPENLDFLLRSCTERAIRALVSRRTVFATEVIHCSRHEAILSVFAAKDTLNEYEPIETVFAASGFRFTVTRCPPISLRSRLPLGKDVCGIGLSHRFVRCTV